MKLRNVAKYFDRLEVRDAYSGKILFKGQFDLFDDSERDAVGVQRRTLSVPPDTLMPARGALDAPLGVKWVVGSLGNVDTFLNRRLREKYTLHRAAGLARISTPGELIQGVGGVEAYVGVAWMKDWREETVSSRAYPYYELFFAASEAVFEGAYVKLGDDIFRVRSSYRSEAGFRVAEADDLDGSLVTVTLVSASDYSPSTDGFTTVSESLPALVFRFAADYLFNQSSAPKFEPGDLTCLMAKVSVPLAPLNAQVVYGGKTYRVLSIDTEFDCWRMHLRP